MAEETPIHSTQPCLNTRPQRITNNNMRRSMALMVPNTPPRTLPTARNTRPRTTPRIPQRPTRTCTPPTRTCRRCRKRLPRMRLTCHRTSARRPRYLRSTITRTNTPSSMFSNNNSNSNLNTITINRLHHSMPNTYPHSSPTPTKHSLNTINPSPGNPSRNPPCP